MRKTWLFLVTTCSILVAAPALTHAQKKVAVVVGIDQYDQRFSKLRSLDYAERDAEAIAESLTNPELGFGFDEVVLMTTKTGKKEPGKLPTRKNILEQLKSKKGKNADTILVFLAGHGLQFEIEVEGKKETHAYYCPHDAVPTSGRTDTLIAMKDLLGTLQGNGFGNRLVLVDACREKPGSRGRGLSGLGSTTVEEGTSVLFSCSNDELSYESQELKHGLFTHYLLAGMRGEAKNSRGEITWASLAAHVIDHMPREKAELPRDLRDMGASLQKPNRAGHDVSVVLGKIGRVEKKEPKPGEERIFDVGKGVKMTFCWVPGSNGKFKLGSPKGEQDYLVKTYLEGKREWLDNENEHEIAGLDGFWMAKYEMTQSQYVLLTGKQNPSWFSAEGGGKDKVKGMNTDEFPVESVSWDDAQESIKAMKVPSGVKRIALPSEAQWEWAARGGRGNVRAFVWGDVLNGDKANSNGEYPYGTATKGEYLGRTTKVGSYASKSEHPWGLCDMHGNVWEWCEDYYGEYAKLPGGKNPAQTVKQLSDSRVLRGGSWSHDSRNCRSAFRSSYAPVHRNGFNGFRVCISLD